MPRPALPGPDLPANLGVEARPVAHLPLIRHVIDQLGIGDVLDEMLPLDPRARVSDADCVTVMLLNILEGRVALYDMEKWLARTDVETLLGPDRPADAFNDSRLALCLDHVADVGTEEVLSAVVRGYLAREDAPPSTACTTTPRRSRCTARTQRPTSKGSPSRPTGSRRTTDPTSSSSCSG